MYSYLHIIEFYNMFFINLHYYIRYFIYFNSYIITKGVMRQFLILIILSTSIQMSIAQINADKDSQSNRPFSNDPYLDQFDDNDRSFWSDIDGYTVTEAGSELIIIGDGSATPNSPFNYMPHDAESLMATNLDLTFNNKVFLRAKSSVDSTILRIDLVDADGFGTTQFPITNHLSTEYQLYEFDFIGSFIDAGSENTDCDSLRAPCPVNGISIENFLVYIDPDQGNFDGTVTIDWIATIEPILTSVNDITIVKNSKIYPNPASNELNIEIDVKQGGNLRATIIDLNGKIQSDISYGHISNGGFTTQINTENLSKGLYYLQLHLDDKSILIDKITVQ